MQNLRGAVLALAASGLLLGAGAPASDPPPAWAFVVPDFGHDPALHGMISVPGSSLKVSAKQLESDFFVPDWFPQDHAKMPSMVGIGHAPGAWACAVCHLPTGVGGPESAVVAGLPAGYIEQQFAEFRAGRRSCPVVKDEACSRAMPQEARLASPGDVRRAAQYFSKLSYRSRIRVVEAAMVPHMRVEDFSYVRAAGQSGLVPIGARILEVPDAPHLDDLGDWRVTITAYVPPGSLRRGAALVRSGAGAAPCTSCHGARFQGIGMVPPLAGRSPSYLYRQLYDIQYGYRRGPAVAPMLPEVAHLTAADRLAIVAYLASLPS